LFLDAVGAMVLAALDRIEDDQGARFALFKKLLAVAQEVANGAEAEGRAMDCRHRGGH